MNDTFDQNKRFALIVRYECGKIVMLTDTLELDKALQEFGEKHAKRYGVDKSSLAPRVLGAEILPLMYESVYN